MNEKIFNFDKHNQVDLFKFPLEAYKTSDVEWADGAPMMVVTSVTGKQYGFRPEEFKRFQRKTDDLTGQHQIKAWDVDSKESYMVNEAYGVSDLDLGLVRQIVNFYYKTHNDLIVKSMEDMNDTDKRGVPRNPISDSKAEALALTAKRFGKSVEGVKFVLAKGRY